MLGLSLSPDVVMEIEVQAGKVHRLAHDNRPLDLSRLRDETAALQSQIAEATSLERRGLGQRRRPRKPHVPVFFAGEAGAEAAAQPLAASPPVPAG